MGEEKRKLIPCMLATVLYKDGSKTEGESERINEIVDDCDLIINGGISHRVAYVVTLNWLCTCDGIEDRDPRDVKEIL